MSTIILSSIFGPPVQVIGSELGTLLGAQLDSAMFDINAEKKVMQVARLQNLQVKTSTYGMVIPIVYGAASVEGNIIWHKRSKKNLSLLIAKIITKMLYIITMLL